MAKLPTKPPLADINILRTFHTLTNALATAQVEPLDEEQCWFLLEKEKAGQARMLFMQRLYGRASTLRAKREAKELRSAAHDA